MVRSYTIEEPNLSYVCLNLNSRAGTVNRENETSTGEEDTKKVYITQNLSASNKKVINAELLNKALTQQNLPPPPPTTALWRPRHLYNDEEKDEIWSDVTNICFFDCVVSHHWLRRCFTFHLIKYTLGAGLNRVSMTC